MARNSKAAPDALQLLKKDHAEVNALFTQFDDATDADEKADLAAQLCRMLTIHAACEEELLYPAAHEAIDDDLVYEAEVEHQSAKDLIARIEDADPEAENFEALVKVLGEYVRHHVREEEGELFAQLKRSDVDLAALGIELAARKAELAAALSAEPDEDEDEDEDDDDLDDDDYDDDDEEEVDVDSIGDDDEGESDRDRAA
jgi:hemerythrin superfamily protein